jgi:predicted small secreted protein
MNHKAVEYKAAQCHLKENIMKKLLLIISILVLALLLIGCMDIEGMVRDTIEEALEGLGGNYTIEVGGTEGLDFSGSYEAVYAAYNPENGVALSTESYNVTGNVSEEYTVDGAIAVVTMFQKRDVMGTLEVRIWRGAELVDSAETTEPWGAVLVTALKGD